MAELHKGERVMYAAAWRTPDGALHYFDGLHPSLQHLRENASPPMAARCWHHPESSSYFFTTSDSEVEEMMKGIDGAHSVEIDAPAYLVRLEGDSAQPVAKWDGAEWVKKK